MKRTGPTPAAAALLALALLAGRAGADAPPNHEPFKRKAKSSSRSTRGQEVEVTECLRGNPRTIRRDDCHGHTVITDEETGEECYGVLDEDTGFLKCAGGVDDEEYNPEKEGVPQGEQPLPENQEALCGAACKQPNRGRTNKVIRRYKEEKMRKRKEQMGGGSGGAEEEEEQKRGLRQAGQGRELIGGGGTKLTQKTMKNLVINLRFKDHRNRCLPSRADLDALFNAVDGHPKHAPSGSVRDCFRYNSHHTFDLVSHVCDWCDTPQTEAYYGDMYYGMTGRLTGAIHKCLAECEASINGGFSDFDKDGDGYIDAIAVIHSGYGSEWGGDDKDGQRFENRIWSHKWEMDRPYQGPSGVQVLNYHISPGLWGTDGCNIGRIGVICHETGHFFGLPDVYDGDGGNGLGTTCLMGNSWGYSGDQYYPPRMSAWAKLQLGWANPVPINKSGKYSLHSAAVDPTVFFFDNPNNDKEYFLIESKQKSNFFDKNLPREGLVIFHIDEKAAHDSESFPGDPEWPKEHYGVAVVQADGRFDLEKGANLGDADDYFNGDFIDELGPNGGKFKGQSKYAQPNTDWYGSGRFEKSGLTIKDISKSGPVMSFTVELSGDGGAGQDADRDWGGGGGGGGTCADTNQPCENHVDCCSPPKRRCKFVRNKGRNVCKLKGRKKKRRRLMVLESERRRRLLQQGRERREAMMMREEE